MQKSIVGKVVVREAFLEATKAINLDFEGQLASDSRDILGRINKLYILIKSSEEYHEHSMCIKSRHSGIPFMCVV